MNNFRELIRRQLELEDDCKALGVQRYRSRLLPWKDTVGSPEEEANLPPGAQLLKTITIPFSEAILQFIDETNNGKAGRRHNAADLFLIGEPLEIAYLTARTVVNNCMCTKGTLILSTALSVADVLIENLEFNTFRQVNKVGFKGFMKKQAQRGYSRQRRAAVKKMFDAEGVIHEMSKSEKISLGMKCVELLIESTDLFRKDTVYRSRGLAYTVRPTETLLDWFDKQHARCEILAPINMPMICRPRRWRSPTYGGYLSPRRGNRLVKQRNQNYHVELRSVDMPKVYDAINHIQDTPWQINPRVLVVMEQVWDTGGCLGGLPQREDDLLPARPVNIDQDEEALKQWKRAAAEVYSRNADRISARVAFHQGLWVARKFAPEAAIYFPHEMDFRGRVYPIPSFGPSPQGSDWQKALLQFAEGKRIGEEGRRWLLIHIANLFGVDKVSFDDRIEWTLSHAAQLCESADAPLDGERFWTTADSPYSALAACFEFAQMLVDGEDFVSHLPIALDGSCSGLQHFSAMLRDEEGGRAVNLTPSEKPQDVYMAVGSKAQAQADASDEEFGRCWSGGKVSRSMAKRPTMTFCYSATRFGMQGMIHQTLREADRDVVDESLMYLAGADNYQASIWLSHVLYSSISETVKAAAVAMDWLRYAAKVAASGGLPLWWTTPMGLPILQEYKAQQGTHVAAFWNGQRIRLVLQVDTDGLCSRSQVNGVAPNFVHSLDAAHLQAVALRARQEGMGHLAFIHDSFGTHAADTGRLSRILRETFVEQYSGDVLGDFYKQLKEQLGPELAEQLLPPPAMGNLDLNLILDAPYAFA